MGYLLRTKLYVIVFCIVHAIWTLSTAPTLHDWYYGYRVIFLLAEAQAVWSYCTVELQLVSQTIKHLQYAAVATTGKAETLSLCREERAWQAHLDRHTSREETPLIHHAVPAGWSVLSLILLVYNTIHLTIGASDDYALLFGVPAIATYITVIRVIQVLCQ